MACTMSVDPLQQEAERLQSSLQQVRDKFLNQWTGDGLQEYLKEQKRKHEEMMARSKGELEALHGSLNQLKEQAKTNQKVVSDRVERLRAMREEMEQLQSETDDMLREKELAEQTMAETQQDIQKAQELLVAQEKATQQRLEELEKSAEWFKDRMALTFKRTTGDRLQIIFTCVDHKDPTRPFFFSVKIDAADGKYIVSDCDPDVSCLPSLVEKLNGTNNFRSFVIAMRQEFKKLV